MSRGKGRRRGRTGRKNAGSPAFRPLQEKAAAAGLPKCPKPGSPFCESIQKCEKRQISFAKKLEAILEAGKYAPSAMGRQSVTMAVLTKKEDIAELSALNAAVMGTSSDPFFGAPCVVVVLADPEATNAANALYGTDRMLLALNGAKDSTCRQLLEALQRGSSADSVVSGSGFSVGS